MNQPMKPPQEVPPRREALPPAGSPPVHKPRSAWGFVITGLVLLLVVSGIVWWARHQGAPEHARGGRNAVPMSIVPQAVGKGDIGVNINALGTVTSLATVTVRTQISGYLMKIDFKEGDEVKKGDVLAEIDSRPYEAALAQAKGNLARDEALLKGAQVDLARYQGLAAQNAVPRQTLDTQVALVAQDEGTVEADRAAVNAAQVNLNYCHIVAPNDGRVGIRQVDQGNYVTPGDANGIVVITQLKPISVLFTVPEDNLQAILKRLQEGAKLPTTALDRSSIKVLAQGTVQSTDSQIDPTTGTIKLRATFPNDDEALFPNQFVNIRLLLDTHKDVTIMPTAGVQRGVPGTFVYLVNSDDTVSVRKIELGITDGDNVEVKSGLQPGDRIVIDGADKLRDGAKINVRSEADSNVAPAGPGATPAAGSDPSKDGGKRRHRQDGQKDGQKQDSGQQQ
jgi:multidrug efflux system membrane fusion protein